MFSEVVLCVKSLRTGLDLMKMFFNNENVLCSL